MNYASTELQPDLRPLPSAQWCRVTNLAGAPAWAVDAHRAVSRLAELRAGWDGDDSPLCRKPPRPRPGVSLRNCSVTTNYHRHTLDRPSAVAWGSNGITDRENWT